MKRRSFINRAACSLTAGLTPLSTLLANNAVAQHADDTRKLLCVFTPNGYPTNDGEVWHPEDGTLHLRRVTAPLEPHKDQCLFLDGINMYGAFNNTHDGGIRAVLTANGNDSIDVAVGEHLNRSGKLPYNSLQFGPYCRRNSRGNTSYKDGFMLPFEDRPVTLYQKLWGADPTQERKNKDLGVLSVLNKDLAKLKQRLGHVEQVKLEQHADALSNLERRLTQLAQQEVKERPLINFYDVTDNDWHLTGRFHETSEVMQDIAVAALSMGLTRSLNFSFGERTFTGHIAGVDDHAASHAGGELHAKTKTIWVQEIAKLMSKLKDTPDGSSNLFNNTLGFHYSEIGSGSSHWFFRMPFFLFGGDSWGLKSGTTHRYTSELWGAPHHKLLTAIALQAGLDVEHFGDGHEGYSTGKGYGTGPFEEIFHGL